MSATVAELLREAADLPGESPRRDAEVLLGHVLGVERSALYAFPERRVAPPLCARYRALLAARRRGEPVAYLIGRREFWSLSLCVSPAVLIPRPETECLVEVALELPLPADARVVDLGTGSGAVALALARERPGWRIVAVDCSPAAVALARHNAARLGLERVEVRESDWFAAAAGPYHLVVSNPPYVAAGDPHLAQGDLRFEPPEALVAGADGLAALREIVASAPRHLLPGGWLAVEHGADQGRAVHGLFTAAGFESVATHCDLAGRPRVTRGRRPGAAAGPGIPD